MNLFTIDPPSPYSGIEDWRAFADEMLDLRAGAETDLDRAMVEAAIQDAIDALERLDADAAKYRGALAA